MAPTQFLITGAAGYIGGTVLTDLLKKYDASSVSVVVRKPEQRELFEGLGVNIVLSDMSDATKLKSLALEHDVVFNYAVAFGGDEASIQALVDGLEERAAKTGTKPVYIHTGGTGTVMYGADGKAGTDEWTDEQYDRWASLPNTAFFYGGYKMIGKISAYTILSPTVYGRGTGPGNKLSLQLPAYTRYAKEHGQAAYIGEGKNIWGNVHIEDLCELSISVAQYALANPDKTTASEEWHGFETLIYSGVDTHTWGPVIETLGDLLHARGDISKPSAKQIGEGEGILYMFGGNSWLAKSKKAEALGYKPKQKDLITSMKDALVTK
ncbi:hypothetical protein LTR78_009768 [Recurvomyces mirabilis]|uniref:NAD(P)-binding domain-containing protein n=1 Tax=Recurvomyces mirabilis TaxID=574656 RepID=A0AAE0WGF0_9PEZI|nr:hypothetical protein LTR78_009768 [Recurvomyces mirabilis]KAK5158186.1 hypothetical protein LTS14_003204 [Recurvomyces mirabilis]